MSAHERFARLFTSPEDLGWVADVALVGHGFRAACMNPIKSTSVRRTGKHIDIAKAAFPHLQWYLIYPEFNTYLVGDPERIRGLSKLAEDYSNDINGIIQQKMGKALGYFTVRTRWNNDG